MVHVAAGPVLFDLGFPNDAQPQRAEIRRGGFAVQFPENPDCSPLAVLLILGVPREMFLEVAEQDVRDGQTDRNRDGCAVREFPLGEIGQKLPVSRLGFRGSPSAEIDGAAVNANHSTAGRLWWQSFGTLGGRGMVEPSRQ